MSFWKNLFTKRSEDWFYYHVPPEQTPNDIEIKNLVSDQDYLNVFLKKMRIVNVRRGLTKFYGAVHSYCKMYHASGREAEFNVVTTASNLKELDAKNIDKVISMNDRLIGPTAYTGGDFEMEVGLFSIKSADLAQPYLSLLQDASEMAGVSFIGAALPYAGLIKNGMNLITGGQADTILEIGLSQTFDIISTGYYVVMRVPKDQVDKTDIRIDDDFRLTNSAGDPIKDFPYMVIQISATPEKDDWAKIPALQTAYQELMESVKKLDYNSAKEALVFFKRTVLISNDLLFEDAKRIYSKVEAKVSEILDTTQVTRSADRPELPLLEEIDIY